MTWDGPLTWARPEAWAILALALPIVLLHLRWRRRREAEVTSLAVWRDVAAAGVGRRGVRRVQEGVQLAALLLALAGFAAALAGPVLGRAAAPSRRLAVIVDASATMNARDGAARRFDAAVAAAGQAIDRLGPGDEVVVWAASARPEVVAGPTTDLAAAKARLAALSPTLDPCGAARTLALAAVAADPRTSFVVVTDAVGAADLRAASARGDEPPAGTVVGVVGAGTARNTGIIDVALDGERRLHVKVARTDGDPAPTTVVLRRDGVEVARHDVTPPEIGTADTAFTLGPDTDAGGLAEVRLVAAGGPGGEDASPDDFAPDDVAELVLPARRRLRVVLVAPGLAPSPYLAAALRAMGDLLEPDSTIAQPEAPAGAFATADVIVVEGALPPAAPRDRPVVQFGAAGRDVERPLVWGDAPHAVLAGIDLTPLRIDRAAVIDVGPGETPLVVCADGPVAAAGEVSGTRRVRFGFVPGATTLPLEPAFPLLLRNALAWVARPPLLPPLVRAGAPITTAEPLPSVDRVFATGPGAGPPRPLLVRDGAIVEEAPLPPPGGPRRMTLRGLAHEETTAVDWFPPDGFHLVPAPPAYPGAAAAALSLDDRRGNVDTRVALAGWCALAGAAALFLASIGRRPRRVVPASASTGAAAPG